jgi:hypothetical protein
VCIPSNLATVYTLYGAPAGTVVQPYIHRVYTVGLVHLQVVEYCYNVTLSYRLIPIYIQNF